MGSGEKDTRYPITPIVTLVEDSHARIRLGLEALESAQDVDEIRAIVCDLPGLLEEHFEEEEKPGGLFDELGSLRPTIDSQLKFLRQEHREISQALESLRQRLREAAEATQVGELEQRHEHIRVSAACFMQLIRHHERIETRLVTDTYYTEDGGSG
jgi:predicted nuclease with TOPRIM domain